MYSDTFYKLRHFLITRVHIHQTELVMYGTEKNTCIKQLQVKTIKSTF